MRALINEIPERVIRDKTGEGLERPTRLLTHKTRSPAMIMPENGKKRMQPSQNDDDAEERKN
jgi:hypothetical protein